MHSRFGAIRFLAFTLFSFRSRSMRHVTTLLTAFAYSFDSSSIPRRCACKERHHSTRFPTLGDIFRISGITRCPRDRLFWVGQGNRRIWTVLMAPLLEVNKDSPKFVECEEAFSHRWTRGQPKKRTRREHRGNCPYKLSAVTGKLHRFS